MAQAGAWLARWRSYTSGTARWARTRCTCCRAASTRCVTFMSHVCAASTRCVAFMSYGCAASTRCVTFMVEPWPACDSFVTPATSARSLATTRYNCVTKRIRGIVCSIVRIYFAARTRTYSAVLVVPAPGVSPLGPCGFHAMFPRVLSSVPRSVRCLTCEVGFLPNR
eukprot:3797522-Pyramimonas_sp.AAC.1